MSDIDIELYELLEDAMPQGKERKALFHKALKSTANGEPKRADNAISKMTGKKPETWNSKDFSDHENKVGDRYQKLIVNKYGKKLENNMNKYRDKHIENAKKRSNSKIGEVYKKVRDPGHFSISNESSLESAISEIEFN